MISLKKIAAFSIFIIINFTFLIKYLSRITDHYIILSVILCLIPPLPYFFRKYFQKFAANTVLYLTTLILYCTIMAIVFALLPVESLKVDRWSVITSFWDTFLSGDYAYSAKSVDGNYPGPMPFYFILALPFFLVGELGYFSLSSVLILAIIFRLKSADDTSRIWLITLLLSPLCLYDIAVRSNIILNSAIILLTIIYTASLLSRLTIKPRSVWLIGLLIGLSLSTRSVFVITYISLFVYSLKSKKIKLSQTLTIGLITVFFFALTFVPFVVGHFKEFWHMNPFIIQSDVLIPFELSLAIIVISFLAGLVSRTQNDVFFFSGVMLFAAGVTHFLYKSYMENWNAAFFNSRADIAYLLFCVPFLIYFLSQETTVGKRQKLILKQIQILQEADL